MFKTLLIIFSFVFIISSSLKAEKLDYILPDNFDFITNIDDDYVELYNKSTNSENLWIWGGIITSTALLYHYDEDLVSWAEGVGAKLGIKGKEEEGSTVLFSIGPYPVLKVPSTIGSSLYFIGDGTVHIGIMAGFLTYGLLEEDNKAVSVGSQLAEGLFDVAIATQVLKHITGRQSPFRATKLRGNWDLFPNQIDYAKDVSYYDAYPSGHLATAMMTVTVLSENYPDNKYILPVGYTLMSLLSFQMLNNGVHWASDYPLAIGMGYTFGKIISSRERNKAKKYGWSIEPKLGLNNYGLVLKYVF